MRIRNLFALMAALSLALVPAVVAAHAHLETSAPAAGENLDEAPDEVVLTFDDELNPDGSSFTVTDADGTEVGSGEVDLDVADRSEMRGDVAIDEPGLYTVTWTIVGSDGHEVTGEFSFGFQSDDPVPTGEAPNTALLAPVDAGHVVLAGILALVAALVATARRVAHPSDRQA